jgi:hypothetical protein
MDYAKFAKLKMACFRNAALAVKYMLNIKVQYSENQQMKSRQFKPNTTVAAIIEQNGKFLLVEEETERGNRYNQPAGHLEDNETLIQAVIRETMEEAAYAFTSGNTRTTTPPTCALPSSARLVCTTPCKNWTTVLCKRCGWT